MDPTLSLMLLLKNNWSLTGTELTGSAITFSTGWYNEAVAFPQITVTSQPGGISNIMETGATPLYFFEEVLSVNIWVRVDSESNKSLGNAKNKEYAIRKEVNRIIRAGAHISTGIGNEEFLVVAKWRRLDELFQPPYIIRSMFEIPDYYFRYSNENTP